MDTFTHTTQMQHDLFQFMATVGGVGGYLQLREQAPELLEQLLAPFGVKSGSPRRFTLDEISRLALVFGSENDVPNDSRLWIGSFLSWAQVVSKQDIEEALGKGTALFEKTDPQPSE